VSIDLQTIANTVARSAVRAAVNTSYKRILIDVINKHCKAKAKAFAKQFLIDNKSKIDADIKKLVIKKLKDEQKKAIIKASNSVKITVNTSYRGW